MMFDVDIEKECFGVDIDGTLTDGINPFASDHVFEKANEIIRKSKPKPVINILRPEMNIVLIAAHQEKHRKTHWNGSRNIKYHSKSL